MGEASSFEREAEKSGDAETDGGFAAMSKTLVITNYSAGCAELAAVSARNHWAYCARHGYDFLAACFSDYEASKGGMPVKIGTQLNFYDTILTVGADVLFMDMEKPICSVIEPGDGIVLAREQQGWSAINNDMMIWRNTGRVHYFIGNLCAEESDWIGNRLCWQQWLVDQLAAGRFKDTFRIVEPRVMNSTPYSGESLWQPGDWIFHAFGFPIGNKIQLLKHYLPLIGKKAGDEVTRPIVHFKGPGHPCTVEMVTG